MRKTNGQPCPGIKYTSEASPVGIHLSEKSLVSFTLAQMHRDSTENDSLFLVNMTFPGSYDRDPQGFYQTPDLANYYIDSLAAEDVKAFHRVYYEDLWSNIDLHFHHGTSGPRMTYEVRPGGDPYEIYMGFDGQDSLNLDWEGNLKIYLEGKWIELQEAVAFQVDTNGDILPVNWTANYEHNNGETYVKFNFDTYDTTKSLILQIGYPPVQLGGGGDRNLEWCTYMGGESGGDEFTSVQVDEVGDPYVCGYSWSNLFPVDPGTNVFTPFIGEAPGSMSAVIAKFAQNNKQLIWATYYGGNYQDIAQKLAVYKGPSSLHQFVFVTGSTSSSDFQPYSEPNTIFDQADLEVMGYAEGKMWIGAFRKFNGRRFWATTHGQTIEEVGWNEYGLAIDVNDEGKLAVGGFIEQHTTSTPQLPTVDPGGNAYVRAEGGGFLMSFNADYQIEWHTAILENDIESRTRIADVHLVKRGDDDYMWFTGAAGYIGNPYTVGLPDYLVNPNPLDPLPIPLPDPNGTYYFQYYSSGYTNTVIGFINLMEHNIAYSTIWSSPSVEPQSGAGHAILETSSGVWVVGQTSGVDFTTSELPLPVNAPSTVLHDLDVNATDLYSRSDAFIIRYKASAFNLDYGTLLGGTHNDIMLDVASDGNGGVYFTGETRSSYGIAEDIDPFKYFQPHHTITNRRDAILLSIVDDPVPVARWRSIFGGTQSERGRSIAASENEVYLVGATSSQFLDGFPLQEFDTDDDLDFYQEFNLGGAWNAFEQFPPWESFSLALDYERFYYDQPTIEPPSTEYDAYIASFRSAESPVSIEQLVGSNSGNEVLLAWPTASGNSWSVRVPRIADWTIQLFDAAGRQLSTSKHTNVLFDLDSEGLASGIYILTATDEQGTRLSIKLPKP